jgi:hypothetical protein
MKLRLAGTVYRSNVEHRTSNIEHRILMALRFIYKYETSVYFSIRLAAFQASGRAET